MKKFISLLLICLMTLSFVACEPLTPRPNDEVNYDGNEKVVLNENVCALSGFQTDALSTFLEQTYSDIIVGTEYTNTEVTLYYPASRLDTFKSAVLGTLNDNIAEFSANNDKYKLIYDEENYSFDIYVTIGVDSTLFQNTVLRIDFYSVLYQLLEGKSYEELNMSFNCYNADTGMLVKTCNGETDTATITGSDWEGSYDENNVFLTLDSSFATAFGIDCETLKDYFSNYQEFLSTLEVTSQSDAVIIVINDEAAFMDKLKNYLSTRDYDIKDLGADYKLELSSDLKSMSIYYDNKVNEEDIARVITTAILETKLIYSFENRTFSDWTLDYSIYNSATKELVKTVHLPDDGISFVGQNDW